MIPKPHEKWHANRPRAGEPVTYRGAPHGTVRRVEESLCWIDYLDGSEPLPFIWCFHDGLNRLRDWPSKGVRP